MLRVRSVSGLVVSELTRDKVRAEEHFFSCNIYEIWAQLKPLVRIKSDGGDGNRMRCECAQWGHILQV